MTKRSFNGDDKDKLVDVYLKVNDDTMKMFDEVCNRVIMEELANEDGYREEEPKQKQKKSASELIRTNHQASSSSMINANPLPFNPTYNWNFCQMAAAFAATAAMYQKVPTLMTPLIPAPMPAFAPTVESPELLKMLQVLLSNKKTY